MNTLKSHNKRRKAALSLAGVLPLLVALAASAAPQMPVETPKPADPAGLEFYEKKVRPLLAAACYQCHGGGSASGNLTLKDKDGWERGGAHGAAVVPGKPDASLLMKRVAATDAGQLMPPGGKLSDAQIGILRQWIAMGAPAPAGAGGVVVGAKHLTGMTEKARQHWAFRPVVKPAVPVVKNKAWVKNTIDSFVLAKLEASGMKPNPPAPREALIRRATYDLTGLPPTVDEVRSFLSDRSPDAWEKVVDRLLLSPHYGERWARHWLDTARYADTRGIQLNGKNRSEDFRYANAWTYRDYVIRSFNEDKPYNTFLMEQLAADRLPGIGPNDPRLAALGFLTVGKRFNNVDDEIDERIDTVTKATLGLTVSCARCHDHKFDPVPQADYYSLHGIFASIIEPSGKPELAGTGLVDQRADFELKLKDLEKKNTEIYYEIASDRTAEFQKKATGFLMISTARARSKERGEIADKYGIPVRENEISPALQRNAAQNPVLAPFMMLSRLPAENFASGYTQAVNRMAANRRAMINPRVAMALKALRPKTLDDVAQAYGALFTEAGRYMPAYLKYRQGTGPYPAGLDSAMAQLIETPFALPAVADIATTDKLMVYVDKLPQVGAAGRDVNRFTFPAINELKLTHPGAPGEAMVVADADTPKDSYIYLRGEKARKGPMVPRRFLEVLSPPDRPIVTAGSGRLELAKAITTPANPLTTRVLVNRVWMLHFGNGFVSTPDDLGNQAEPPTHPELLDWLSSWMVEKGYSLKKLHKAILMSNTYQESSVANPAYATKDPGNHLLWRANLRRLDFEAIRDSMVLLTGKMDGSLYGKPVNLTDEPYSYRRSVYGYVDRLALSDLMQQFDYPDPDMANSHRISTIVPQQALFFLNSPMAVDVARQVTARPEVVAAADDAAKVKAIYLTLFQRSPKPEEVVWAQQFVAQAEKQMTPADAAQAKQLARMEQAASRRAAQQAAQRKQKAQGTKYGALQNEGEVVARGPLTPWQLYAQALLCTNEFVYVN